MCILCRLSAWARRAVALGPTSIGAPCLSMHDLYCMFFCLNTDFVGNTKQYMFNFTYIYSFIPMSGSVGMGPSVLPCPGARDAVKTVVLLLLLSKKQ